MDAGNIAQPALVTGATGFIGRALTRRLLQEGVRVRALVLPEESTDGVLPESVEVVRGDVTDAAALSAAMRAAGTVFHLAAVVGDWGEEELFQRVSVGGTRNVLSAAADNGTRVFLASSVVVYGDRIPRQVCHEDLPLGRALGPYSRSKQQQEQVAQEFARAGKVKLTVVRPTNVYGPGSRPWVHEVVTLLKSGGPSLIGGGAGKHGQSARRGARRAGRGGGRHFDRTNRSRSRAAAAQRWCLAARLQAIADGARQRGHCRSERTSIE